MVRKKKTILPAAFLLAFSGCVLFSLPSRQNPFDPSYDKEGVCTVIRSGSDATVSWTPANDYSFTSYTVLRALNPEEMRDFMLQPSTSIPQGISVRKVITNSEVLSCSDTGLDPVYPSYFGVVYATRTGRKGSSVATARP